MRILISRHGEAATGFADHERPLTEKGKNEIRNVAGLLKQMNVKPEYIISSPLKRAKETADIYSSVLEPPNNPFTESSLQPGGYIDDVVSIARSLNNDILFVGHQPDISNFITGLSGPSFYNVYVYPGTVASIVFDNEVIPGRGTLEFLLKPF